MSSPPSDGKPLDSYATLTLRFEPSGEALVGDFDTGASVTAISYEWLVQHGVIEPSPHFARGVRLPDRQFTFAVVELKARLVAEASVTEPAVARVWAVRDLADSPFGSHSGGLRNGRQPCTTRRDIRCLS